MSAFSPSPQFAKRWLSLPDVIKNAFYQEIDDVIAMLREDGRADEFEFHYTNFGQSVADLIFIHKDENKAPMRFIHALDNSVPFDDTTHHDNKTDVGQIQDQITQKLSVQIDDFLGEHMTQLSDDLKAWLQMAIKNELANYK